MKIKTQMILALVMAAFAASASAQKVLPFPEPGSASVAGKTM